MSDNKILYNEYLFFPASKEVWFRNVDNTIGNLSLDQILMIVNVTTNTIIYLPTKLGLGGNLMGYTLVLDFDTALMSETDKLQIFIDITREGKVKDTIKDISLLEYLSSIDSTLKKIENALIYILDDDSYNLEET